MRITLNRGAYWRATHVIMAGLICAISGSAAWQAGVARVDITPSQPVWMGGYASRTHPSEGVRQHIFAKALALKDDTGAVTVLVTSDLLGFPGEVSAPIFTRVQQEFGLPRERITLNSSHTHSAPVVGDMLSPAYPLRDADRKVIRAYTAHLQDQVVEVIGKAIRNLAPRGTLVRTGLCRSGREPAPRGPPGIPGPGGAGCSCTGGAGSGPQLTSNRFRIRLSQHGIERLSNQWRLGRVCAGSAGENVIPAPLRYSCRTAEPMRIRCPGTPWNLR